MQLVPFGGKLSWSVSGTRKRLLRMKGFIMLTRIMFIGVILATLVLALGGAAEAASIAAFDVNVAGSPTQTGYAAIDFPQTNDGGTNSATQNGITCEVTFDWASRDRGTSGPLDGHALAELYREIAASADHNGQDVNVELSGLSPDTPYNLLWHHYDNGDPDTGTTGFRGYKDSVDPANLLFETAADGYGRDQPESAWSSAFAVTSDASGQISLISGSHSDPDLWMHSITGFEVVSIVPEPSMFLLIAAGLFSLLGYGWRRW